MRMQLVKLTNSRGVRCSTGPWPRLLISRIRTTPLSLAASTQSWLPLPPQRGQSSHSLGHGDSRLDFADGAGHGLGEVLGGGQGPADLGSS